MIIGKIYSDIKLNSINELIEVHSIESYDEDDNTNVPLLLIGKKNVESIFGKDKIHVLNKEISNNLFWTFSKFEKRNIFENDVKQFIDYCYSNIRNNITYNFFNLFTERYTSIKMFLNKLNNSNNSVIYISQDTLYIYVSEEKTIYGISKEQLNLLNISINKIVLMFNNKPNISLLFNNEFLELSTIFKLKDDIKLIPYLFYLNM